MGDVPEWFRDPRAARIDPQRAECPQCGAPRGVKCRYTTATNSHKDPETGRYVENEVGAEMVRCHVERHAAARKLAFEPRPDVVRLVHDGVPLDVKVNPAAEGPAWEWPEGEPDDRRSS